MGVSEKYERYIILSKEWYVIDKNEYLGKPYLTVGTRLVKKVN